MMKASALMVVLGALVTTAAAEVTERSAGGFVSVHELQTSASSEQVYRALTDEVARWWDAEHSWSGEASNFSLAAEAGGCFCERLADGGSVEHMRVVFAQPGRRLVLKGGLGPLQEMSVAGTMTFDLRPGAQGGTTLHYRYVVGGYAPDGLEQLADAVDQVQLGQLQRLVAYLSGTQVSE
jgi:uncharacterized protein YndB with AHSA1/START domain